MLERIQKTEVFFFVLALAEMLLWVAMVIAGWGNSQPDFYYFAMVCSFCRGVIIAFDAGASTGAERFDRTSSSEQRGNGRAESSAGSVGRKILCATVSANK